MAEVKNEVATLLVVSWTLDALIICMSTARIWVRWAIVGQLGWDDFFNVLGTVCSSISCHPITWLLAYLALLDVGCCMLRACDSRNKIWPRTF